MPVPNGNGNTVVYIILSLLDDIVNFQPLPLSPIQTYLQLNITIAEFNGMTDDVLDRMQSNCLLLTATIRKRAMFKIKSAHSLL